MLFNSYQFLFLFFPCSLLVFHLLGRRSPQIRIAVMLAASIVFYASWDVRFLLLLGGSILTNFGFGRALERAVEPRRERLANWLLALGVASNLLVLGAFKYTPFMIANLNAISGADFTVGRLILPLGISFFTFEQIGYLVDVRRGHRYGADLLRFAVFVSFFPRLVAGPILRYSEILPQLSDDRRTADQAENLAVGLTMFAIGLVKKAVLADGIAPFASPVFAAAASGAPVDFFLAWGGALAYTCQLYFDFSGYSDMAIGAARCFGIQFPANFNSPYKSSSIIEFWRRWHMTLSRFLRDYLYIPLGGNRRGPVRRYLNLMITMLLGGLWHGANWTFVAWGGLHGLYLMVNHGWAGIRANRGAPNRLYSSFTARAFGFALTFVAVVVAWVFFRAPSFAAALDMLGGMAGRHGATLPAGLAFALHPVMPVLRGLGIGFAHESGSQMIRMWSWITALLAIAWVLPNSQELLARYRPVLEMNRNHTLTVPTRLVWRLTPAWAIFAGALAFLGVISITHVSEFLYWQF